MRIIHNHIITNLNKTMHQKLYDTYENISELLYVIVLKRKHYSDS